MATIDAPPHILCIINCLQILQFLELLYDSIQEFNKTEEDRKMADVIGTEITKWIELLVNNINMFADDAVHYLRELRSHSRIGKTYQKIITASVSELLIFCGSNDHMLFLCYKNCYYTRHVHGFLKLLFPNAEDKGVAVFAVFMVKGVYITNKTDCFSFKIKCVCGIAGI